MRILFSARSKDGDLVMIKLVTGGWVLILNGEVLQTSQDYKVLDTQVRTLIGTYPRGFWKVVI
jgi:hypothetical protein